MNSRLGRTTSSSPQGQVTPLDRWNARRRAIANGYLDGMKATNLTLPFVAPDAEPVWRVLPCEAKSRETPFATLLSLGVTPIRSIPRSPRTARLPTVTWVSKKAASRSVSRFTEKSWFAHWTTHARCRGGARDHERRWALISPLRATGIIASGTLIYLAVGVAVAKALALFVGPEGVGIWGLMQSVTGLLGMVAGIGVATSLVRLIAAAVAAQRPLEAHHFRLAGLILASAATAVVSVLAVFLAAWTATRILGDSAFVGAVPLLGVAVGLTLLGASEQASLNGWHRLRELRAIIVLSSVAGGVLTITLVGMFGVAESPQRSWRQLLLAHLQAPASQCALLACHSSVGGERRFGVAVC